MIFKFLANNVAIMLAMGLFYGVLIHKKPYRFLRWRIGCGVLFGLAAVVTMANSYVLRPGAIFDCRSVVLSVTGMFAGPIPALIATLIASAYRIWQGGVGALTGVLVIFSTAAVGVVFYYLRQSKPYLNKLPYLYAFGVLVHIVMLLLMLTFPWDIAIQVLKNISFPVIVLFPIGTALLGKIFTDQENNLSMKQQLTAVNQQLRAGEQQLKEAASLLTAALESTVDGILVVDINGKITQWNQRFSEMWQLPETILCGRSDDAVLEDVLSQLIAPEDFMAKVRALYSDPEASSFDQLEFKDGRIFERYSQPQKIDKVVAGRVWSFRDVTDRKKAERERGRLMRLLESKNEELQSIIYISSHDLKTPLVNIAGFSDMLATYCRRLTQLLCDDRTDETVQNTAKPLLELDIPEALHFITLSTHKMKTLIDGLLEVSRIGTMVLHPDHLDMNALIKSILHNAAYRIQETGAEVITDDLPACVADADHINQVFSNLLDNALKYADPHRKPRIHLSGQRREGHCVYCVEDNGIGIHPDHQSRIFELFHRLNPQSDVKGEGLGLTIVRRILDMHNGKVWIESVPGQGSKFFVSLSNNEEA